MSLKRRQNRANQKVHETLSLLLNKAYDMLISPDFTDADVLTAKSGELNKKWIFYCRSLGLRPEAEAEFMNHYTKMLAEYENSGKL